MIADPATELGNSRVEIVIRHAEPDDYEAIHRILSGPRAIAGTLQLPFQSVELVRKRFSEAPEGSPLSFSARIFVPRSSSSRRRW